MVGKAIIFAATTKRPSQTYIISFSINWGPLMTNEYLTRKRFTELTAKFPQTNIAVIGDFFLDEYLILDKRLSEISVETNLEAYQVTSTRKNPGAAGTVTNILRSLDAPVAAIGFTGDDGHGFELRRALTK